MKVLHVFTLGITAESFFDHQFLYLTDAGYEIHVAASTAPTYRFQVENHVTFHKVEISRRIDIKADILAIYNLIRLIRREKFDAIFGHTPKGALVAMTAGLLSGVSRRIYYRHGLIYTTARGGMRIILKTIERFTALCATKVINVSPSLSKLALSDRLNPESKQCIIGSGTCGGIDTINMFNPDYISTSKLRAERAKWGLGPDDFVVGFCGRLCNDKGITELVDGFHLFKSAHPEIRPKLILVGGYDSRDVLIERTRRLIDTDDSIMAIGRQDHEKLPLLYSLMDVFVFPSYREGFGMSVIEASAMQVPILVSRSHGCVDSIVENVTGRYIDISAESIAENLAFMLDEQVRKKMGVKGREFVAQNFEQTIMWPKISQLYYSVLQ